ncbi:Cytochrome c-type biogenesis protein CcmB [mine drainage metagenome]|uniref:Heme exporter protein B n=1 Tax=mine drainage metagenome TaxID=410659 RepID=T1BIL7_9ZZZZ
MGLSWRERRRVLLPLVFFVIVASLFPLAMSPRPDILRLIAPGVIWVDVMLATFLGLESLFRQDYEEGVLEQWILSPSSLELRVFLKVISFWTVTSLPLIAMSPILVLWLSFPLYALGVLVVGLFLGTVALSFLGALGAALTVSLRQSGMLVAILLLPVATPILIFGAHSAMLAADQENPRPALYLLATLFFLTVGLVPKAISTALKVSYEV